MSSFAQNATVVLVHGAWADARLFSWLQCRLAPLRLARVFGASSLLLPRSSRALAGRRGAFGGRPGCKQTVLYAAGDESGFIEDFEMVGDGRRRHTSHGDEFTARDLAGGRDRLKYPEPGFVSQRL